MVEAGFRRIRFWSEGLSRRVCGFRAVSFAFLGLGSGFVPGKAVFLVCRMRLVRDCDFGLTQAWGLEGWGCELSLSKVSAYCASWWCHGALVESKCSGRLRRGHVGPMARQGRDSKPPM